MSSNISIVVPCGKYTGSFVTNVESCAAPASSDAMKQDPQSCWDHCIDSAEWVAIVWGKGYCGAVHISNIGTCSAGNSDDYEYYEINPMSCSNAGKQNSF